MPWCKRFYLPNHHPLQRIKTYTHFPPYDRGLFGRVGLNGHFFLEHGKGVEKSEIIGGIGSFDSFRKCSHHSQLSIYPCPFCHNNCSFGILAHGENALGGNLEFRNKSRATKRSFAEASSSSKIFVGSRSRTQEMGNIMKYFKRQVVPMRGSTFITVSSPKDDSSIQPSSSWSFLQLTLRYGSQGTWNTYLN